MIMVALARSEGFEPPTEVAVAEAFYEFECARETGRETADFLPPAEPLGYAPAITVVSVAYAYQTNHRAAPARAAAQRGPATQAPACAEHPTTA